MLGYAGLVDGSIPYLPIPGLREFHNEVAAELFGIGIGVLLIDFANERRAIRERKEELILQMGSPDNAVAVEAVRILDNKGWLTDGTLYNVHLWRANLKGAWMRYANLENSLLKDVNLENAILTAANLNYAALWGANLSKADMVTAHLYHTFSPDVNMQYTRLGGATLADADLHDADLRCAELQGAILDGANLLNVQLEGAIFDKYTVLPDSTHWVSETDMRRFTDPNHPNFWRSDYPHSPAYKGNKTNSAIAEPRQAGDEQ